MLCVHSPRNASTAHHNNNNNIMPAGSAIRQCGLSRCHGHQFSNCGLEPDYPGLLPAPARPALPQPPSFPRGGGAASVTCAPLLLSQLLCLLREQQLHPLLGRAPCTHNPRVCPLRSGGLLLLPRLLPPPHPHKHSALRCQYFP